MKAIIGYPVDAPEKQHIEVVVDNYDTWSADFTIATIALPLLRQLKTTKHGAPNVDDDDVPEELRRSEAPPQEYEYDPDAFWFQRWDYVIDEMIFAMSEIATNKPGEDVFYKYPDDFIDSEEMSFHTRLTALQFDEEGWTKYHNRVTNGCRLFGKYFQCLWD